MVTDTQYLDALEREQDALRIAREFRDIARGYRSYVMTLLLFLGFQFVAFATFTVMLILT